MSPDAAPEPADRHGKHGGGHDGGHDGDGSVTAEGTTTERSAAEAAAAARVAELLQAHVPLTLLVDLFAPLPLTSAEILRSEGLPETAWWQEPDEASEDPDS